MNPSNDDQISREFTSDYDNDIDDDDEYRHFLTGLFSDEINEELEDEEEYNPDLQEEEDDEEEEEEEEDDEDDVEDEEVEETDDDDESNLRGLKKVGKHEVQDLVDGCWKTLLGGNPNDSQLTSNYNNEENVDRNRTFNPNQNSTSSYKPPKLSNTSHFPSFEFEAENDILSVTTYDSDDYKSNIVPSDLKTKKGSKNTKTKAKSAALLKKQNTIKKSTKKASEVNQSSSSSSLPNNDAMRNMDIEQEYINENDHKDYDTNSANTYQKKYYKKLNKEQKSISKIVNQLFSSDLKLSELNIDGYPITGYRKIVARQLSIASQLLLQLFLSISNKDSAEFRQCQEFYNQLSRHRQKSLQRSVLIQMNVNNLITFKNSNLLLPHDKPESNRHLTSSAYIKKKKKVDNNNNYNNNKRRSKLDNYSYNDDDNDNNNNIYIVPSSSSSSSQYASPLSSNTNTNIYAENENYERKMTRSRLAQSLNTIVNNNSNIANNNTNTSQMRSGQWKCMLDLPILRDPSSFHSLIDHFHYQQHQYQPQSSLLLPSVPAESYQPQLIDSHTMTSSTFNNHGSNSNYDSNMMISTPSMTVNDISYNTVTNNNNNNSYLPSSSSSSSSSYILPTVLSITNTTTSTASSSYFNNYNSQQVSLPISSNNSNININNNSTSTSSIHNKIDTLMDTNFNQKFLQLNENIHSFCRSLQTPYWHCLLPLSSYPLSQEFLKSYLECKEQVLIESQTIHNNTTNTTTTNNNNNNKNSEIDWNQDTQYEEYLKALGQALNTVVNTSANNNSSTTCSTNTGLKDTTATTNDVFSLLPSLPFMTATISASTTASVSSGINTTNTLNNNNNNNNNNSNASSLVLSSSGAAAQQPIPLQQQKQQLHSHHTTTLPHMHMLSYERAYAHHDMTHTSNNNIMNKNNKTVSTDSYPTNNNNNNLTVNTNANTNISNISTSGINVGLNNNVNNNTFPSTNAFLPYPSSSSSSSLPMTTTNNNNNNNIYSSIPINNLFTTTGSLPFNTTTTANPFINTISTNNITAATNTTNNTTTTTADSLYDQNVFTPAEDDLLLRGIVTNKEYNWSCISNSFLPNKPPHVLINHFQDMCGNILTTRNIFKE